MAQGVTKPLELEALDGFPGKAGNAIKRAHEAVTMIPSVGPPFDDMSPQAKEKWKVLQFEWNAVLKETDREFLRMYCESWAEYQKAVMMIAVEGEVTTNGAGSKVRSPWILIRDKHKDDLMKMLIQFGATPAARARVFANLAKGDALPSAGKFGGLVQ